MQDLGAKDPPICVSAYVRADKAEANCAGVINKVINKVVDLCKPLADDACQLLNIVEPPHYLIYLALVGSWTPGDGLVGTSKYRP